MIVAHPAINPVVLSIVKQQFRIVVDSSGKLSDHARYNRADLILDALLYVYQWLLPGSEWPDQSDDITEAIPITAVAGGSGRDDDPPDGDPPDENDGELKLYILDELSELPSIQHLISDSIEQKRQLLNRLHQRIQQAIHSGHYHLAAILRDRIMVVEADRDELLAHTDYDAVAPEAVNRLAISLLDALLADTDELSEYGQWQVGQVLRNPVSASQGKSTPVGNRDQNRES